MRECVRARVNGNGLVAWVQECVMLGLRNTFFGNEKGKGKESKNIYTTSLLTVLLEIHLRDVPKSTYESTYEMHRASSASICEENTCPGDSQKQLL